MRKALAALVAATVTITSPAYAGLLFEGSEFQVNTYTANAQFNYDTGRSVSRNPDGTFVVVWVSRLPSDGYNHAVGQRFDASGAPAGTEFQVDSAPFTSNVPVYGAAVSSADDGDFVVVWSIGGGDGESYYTGIRGRRFDSAGAAVGTEFQVNTYTTGDQDEMAVASAADGRFVVVWKTLEDGYNVISGQRFDSAGAPAGTEFKVNTTTGGIPFSPAVSSASDGSFIVVWDDDQTTNIYAQRFNSAGAASGTEFVVNGYTTYTQLGSSVSSAADGRFVVVWHGSEGSGFDIRGQRFDSAGALAGTEFQVNTYTTGHQEYPVVSMADDGSFAVVWESFLEGSYNRGLSAQHYDSTGAPSGTEFQVNTYTTGAQGNENQSIAVDAAGNFVVVWESEDQDGSGEGMFGQLLCNSANPGCTTTTTTTTTTLPADYCLGQPSTSGCNVNGVVGPCVGTDGDDHIRGTAGNDVIQGLEGNDTISSSKGTDVVCGGEGDDRIRSGRAGGQIDGGPGNDSIRGGRADDALSGGAGDDTLYGGIGADTLIGDGDNDRVDGGKGLDSCDAESESRCEQ